MTLCIGITLLCSLLEALDCIRIVLVIIILNALVGLGKHCLANNKHDCQKENTFKVFHIYSFRLRILFYIDVMDVYFNNLLKIHISIPTVKSLLMSNSFPPLLAYAWPHRHLDHDCIHLKGSNVVLGCKYTKFFRKGTILVYSILFRFKKCLFSSCCMLFSSHLAWIASYSLFFFNVPNWLSSFLLALSLYCHINWRLLALKCAYSLFY